jgi:hypothetical protein
MSIELRDIRAKVTIEADIALEVECAALGKEKSELVREIIQGWAERRIHFATVLGRRLHAEGISGNPRESQGSSGRGRADA